MNFSSWLYGRILTVDSPRDSTAFPLELPIDEEELVRAGKLKADCSDLRVVSPGADRSLPVYAERVDSGDRRRLWFRPPGLQKGSSRYVVLYGNSAAGPAGAVSQVFEPLLANASFEDVLTPWRTTSNQDMTHRRWAVVDKASGSYPGLPVDGVGLLHIFIFRPSLPDGRNEDGTYCQVSQDVRLEEGVSYELIFDCYPEENTCSQRGDPRPVGSLEIESSTHGVIASISGVANPFLHGPLFGQRCAVMEGKGQTTISIRAAISGGHQDAVSKWVVDNLRFRAVPSTMKGSLPKLSLSKEFKVPADGDISLAVAP